jgi:hypothetical protein
MYSIKHLPPIHTCCIKFCLFSKHRFSCHYTTINFGIWLLPTLGTEGLRFCALIWNYIQPKAVLKKLFSILRWLLNMPVQTSWVFSLQHHFFLIFPHSLICVAFFFASHSCNSGIFVMKLMQIHDGDKQHLFKPVSTLFSYPSLFFSWFMSSQNIFTYSNIIVLYSKILVL